MSLSLMITVPSDAGRVIAPGRHIKAEGCFEGYVPSDGILTVSLEDEQGRVLRRACCSKKNSEDFLLYKDDLTGYPEAEDPGRAGLRRFGFAELMVRDKDNPQESLRDASIKAFYSDSGFKAVLVSATDKTHGLAADDGMFYVSPDGEPYDALPEGSYTVRAELRTPAGLLLASDAKSIEIAQTSDKLICRFNPAAHKRAMLQWAAEKNISAMADTIPGYLESYTGKWLYHMGLLTMYRANDLALYTSGTVHMFVYLIDDSSTSYETELGYLQSTCALAQPGRFKAYHYDTGEALLHKTPCGELAGRKIEFGSDTLQVCRVDIVADKAREGFFDLDEHEVVCSLTDVSDLQIPAGCRFAVMGVIKPVQMDPEDFRLKPDNTYVMGNGPALLEYSFRGEVSDISEIRYPGLERFDEESIGGSVFEFYNIFMADPSLAGQSIRVRIVLKDKKGCDCGECSFSYTITDRHK